MRNFYKYVDGCRRCLYCLLAVVATACGKGDNDTPDMPPQSGSYPVDITFDRSAIFHRVESVSTRADGTVSPYESERSISDVTAVAFFADGTKEGTLYRTFRFSADKIDAATNSLTFDMEREGTFDIWMVANSNKSADDNLQAEIESLKEGVSTVSDFKKLNISKLNTESGCFIMVSPVNIRLRTVAGSVLKVTAPLERLAARIDIVNLIPGLTITGVNVTGLTDCSLLDVPDTPETFIPRDTAPLWTGNLEGKEEDEITDGDYLTLGYTYENPWNNDEGGTHSHPVDVTVTYDYNGTTGLTMTRPFAILQNDMSTRIAVKRNHVYRLMVRTSDSGSVTVTKSPSLSVKIVK